MDKNKLYQLKDWFIDYASSYKTGNPDNDLNIDLKEDHTLRVCEEVLYLCEALGLSDNDMMIAETMALLHDLGRFEQYMRFNTFLDAQSVDHAQLSVSIINERKILDSLSSLEKNLIIRSISYHNLICLPEDETELCLFFCRILRDADKIDIWKVCEDLFSTDSSSYPSGITRHFPDTPGISESICNDLLHGKNIKYSDAKNLNDYKLMQIGCIYDINFKPSFIRIRERNYLQMLYDSLPRSEKKDKIFKIAEKYLDDQIGH